MNALESERNPLCALQGKRILRRRGVIACLGFTLVLSVLWWAIPPHYRVLADLASVPPTAFVLFRTAVDIRTLRRYWAFLRWQERPTLGYCYLIGFAIAVFAALLSLVTLSKGLLDLPALCVFMIDVAYVSWEAPS